MTIVSPSFTIKFERFPLCVKFVPAVVLLCLCAIEVYSQDHNLHFRHLTLADGLLDMQVSDGMQDSRGFVWFATRQGVQRYDGKQFLTFTDLDGDLRQKNVHNILEDDNGKLWMFYGKDGNSKYRLPQGSITTGIDILDISTFETTPYTEFFGSSNAPPETSVIYACNGPDNSVFIVTSDSLLFHYTAKKGWKKIYKGSFSGVYAGLLPGREKIWFAETDSLMTCIDYEGNILARLHRPGVYGVHMFDLDENENCVFTETRRIKTGLATISKVMIASIDGIEEAITSATFSPADDLYRFLRGHGAYHLITNWQSNPFNDDLWISTRKGWSVLKSDGTFSRFLGEDNLVDREVISDAHVFFTKTNQAWFCTHNGVYRLDYIANRFEHYLTQPSSNYGQSSSSSLRNIYADDDILFAATHPGVYQVTLHDAIAGKFIQPDSFWYYSLYRDSNLLWLAGFELIGYDLENDKIKHRVMHPPGTGPAWSMLRTSTGHLLTGTQNGVFYSPEKDRQPVPITGNDSMFNIFIYQLVEKSKDEIWAVTNSGIYALKNHENADSIVILRRYRKKGEGNFRLPSQSFHHIHFDKRDENIIWLATNGDGLIKWNFATGETRQFTRSDGLSSNVLYAILEDDNGQLWISSNYGLMRFSTKTGAIKTYTEKDGITHHEFNRISYFQAKDGRMYFGGLNGITAFHPDDFADDSVSYSPSLQITEFTQFDGSQGKDIDRTGELITTNRILLKPNDRSFTLSFQLLGYEDFEPSYAYKIDGFDQDWNYIAQNSIRISGLPAGEYTVRVKGQGENGYWSESELAIPLAVLTPFYKKTWFIVSSITTVLLIIFGWFRYRTQQLKKRQALLENTVAERTVELKKSADEKTVLLKEIHHRVKNNLEIISSLLELQSATIEDENVLGAVAEGRNRVKSMSLIHQKLYQTDNLASIDMQHYIEDLSRFLYNTFNIKGKEINTVVNAPNISLDVDTAVPIGLILNELISNAYKYAFMEKDAGTINIRLSKLGDDKLELVMSDDGKGLPEDFNVSRSASLGLRLVSILTRQLKGQLTTTSENRTQFQIIFTPKSKVQ